MPRTPALDHEALALIAEHLLHEPGDRIDLRALFEEASEAGANRALARLGLDDPAASYDLRELRQLLLAWRDMRRTARRALVGWLVRLAISALLLGILFELKLGRLIGS